VADDPDTLVTAPFAGTVIAIARGAQEQVGKGEALVVLEAMKMEHEVVAERSGTIRQVEVEVGQTVQEGQLLAVVAPGEQPADAQTTDDQVGPDDTR